MARSYAFAGFRFDPAGNGLQHGGTAVDLTAKASAVLELLVRSAPAVVSREEFETVIWPEGFIEPSNLTQTIYMIRKTLARFGERTIVETLTMRGYRIAVPVEKIESSAELRSTLFARISSSLVFAAGLACAATMFTAARATTIPMTTPGHERVAERGTHRPQLATAARFAHVRRSD